VEGEQGGKNRGAEYRLFQGRTVIGQPFGRHRHTSDTEIELRCSRAQLEMQVNLGASHPALTQPAQEICQPARASAPEISRVEKAYAENQTATV
jgi:hypothetical protein